MIITTVYVIAFFFLLVYIFILLKYVRLWNSTPDFSSPSSDSDISITVIIPFYNEEKNIGTLIQSLLQQSLHQNCWSVLFINDNSTDRSIEIIHKLCDGHINYKIISNCGFGKKAALTTGLNIVKEGLVITTDADCSFPLNWMETISLFSQKYNPDLIIMPVVMSNNNSFWQQFQSIDFLALQMTGAGAALSKNPILCNGANLAFKKQKEAVDLNEKYTSGEDMFILEWMKHKGKEIKYLKSKDVIAKTLGPETFGQFINQRARWISKAGGYRNTSIVLMSLLFFGVNVFQWILLITGLISQSHIVFWLIFFALKTIIDFSLINSGFTFFKVKVTITQFILMQLAYPLYMLYVSIYGILFPVKWKLK